MEPNNNYLENSLNNVESQPTNSSENWEIPPLYQLYSLLLGFVGLKIVGLIISLLVTQIYKVTYPNPTDFALMIESNQFGMTVNVVSYVILLVSFIFMLFEPLKKHFPKFKNYLAPIKGIGYGFLIMLASALIGLFYQVFKINVSDNINEEAITSIMTTYPFWSFIAFVLAGPIVEELTYRLGLFSLIKRWNRVGAYAVTSLLFGLIHFNWEATSLINELLNLPFYVIAGVGLALVYDFEGLHVSIFAHITNNFVSFIFSFIPKGMGGGSSSSIIRLLLHK